jgi:hypothetical protein
MKTKLLKIAMSLLLTLSVSAHEGHSHDAPTILQPLQGGTIKVFEATNSDGSTKYNCYSEVTKSKNEFKIYFFNAEKKNVPTSDFKLVASAISYSRGKASKPEILALEVVNSKKKFFKTSFDKKNANRFDLKLEFTGPAYCKTDEILTFSFE